MPGRDLIERVRKALRDRYSVTAAVGRGGHACIFSGRDASGADVAIKVLHPELTISVAADRFLREIRYASQLNHPHIARVIDSGEADYLLWYVMPYVPGDNLRQTLRREPRLRVPDVGRVAVEVLNALEHAHAHGIAHRDIKPDNIVLSPTGAVLVDLGIARAIARSGDDRVTRSGFVVGTEEYMSPRSEEHTSELQSQSNLVCRLLLEKKKHVHPAQSHPARQAVQRLGPDLRRLFADRDVAAQSAVRQDRVVHRPQRRPDVARLRALPD